MKRPFQAPGRSQPVHHSFAGPLILLACIVALFFFVGGAFALSGPLIPSQKQHLLQTLDQQIARARTPTGPKNVTNPGVHPAQSAAMPQEGITQTHEGPFPPSFFLVQSLWQGPLGNSWMLAYAGAKPASDSSPQQGGILLYTAPKNAPMGSDLHLVGTFLAPGQVTSLSILSANGNLLQLRTDSGGLLTFDLQTHLYRT
jgi:hypothetical protein